MLIVGAEDDPHVDAVVARIGERRDVAVIDAASLASRMSRFDGKGFTLVSTSGTPILASVGGLAVTSGERPESSDGAPNRGRGWVRRLAPAGWDDGVRIGSAQAATAASRLTTLAAIIRTGPFEWATKVDDLFAAENKIVQYSVAGLLGIPVPTWALTTSPNDITETVGSEVVLKPLGPGQFREPDGTRRVVYVEKHRVCDLADLDWISSPFIAQQPVITRTHLRVVTVHDRAWVATLVGDGLPVDWRSDEAAHQQFQPTDGFPEVRAQAIVLARKLGAGFTSQDWLVTAEGDWYFIDLNPGGQWLFLPDAVAEPATVALADWLAGAW